jgi:hypothetical protein
LQRDLKLDFLRGYALLVMTIDHVMVRRSLAYLFTARGTFYLTAAEAFYFLSGLVLGVITSRQPLDRAMRRVWVRAFQLYIAAIGISAFFTALGVLTPLSLWFDLHTSLPRGPELIPFVLGFFTLQNAFHGAEFLVLYVLLLAAAPLALWLHARGLDWAALGLSVMLYAVSQLRPETVRLPFDTIFFPSAWQVLFFGGLFLGWRREMLSLGVKEYLERFPVFRIVMFSLLLSICTLFLWLHLTRYEAWPGLPALLGNREQQLNPLRLGLAGIYMLAFYLIVRAGWKPLSAALGWLLLPLGQNSLWSFSAHLLAVVLVTNLPFYTRNTTRPQGALFHLLALALVWGSVKLRSLWLVRREGISAKSLLT